MPPTFANHPVSGQIGWPRQEITFNFGAHEILAFPANGQHGTSLHIDIDRSRLSPIAAMSILSQVVSISSWLDDTYAALEDGSSGTSAPVRQDRQNPNCPNSISDDWCNTWGPIENPLGRRAVAIYREAMTMYHAHSIPYAALGFYKI